MRLVDADSSCRYLALSYLWGKAKTFETTKSNLHDLKQDSSLIRFKNQIPRVINDAILLTSKLEERFLWVDALCIVQDDVDVKQTQISQMDMIYDQAVLTIVALSGKDANASLPGIAEGSRQCQ